MLWSQKQGRKHKSKVLWSEVWLVKSNGVDEGKIDKADGAAVRNWSPDMPCCDMVRASEVSEAGLEMGKSTRGESKANRENVRMWS